MASTAGYDIQCSCDTAPAPMQQLRAANRGPTKMYNKFNRDNSKPAEAYSNVLHVAVIPKPGQGHRVQQAAKVNESVREPSMRLLCLQLRALALAVQVACQRLRSRLDQLACELLKTSCGVAETPVSSIQPAGAE